MERKRSFFTKFPKKNDTSHPSVTRRFLFNWDERYFKLSNLFKVCHLTKVSHQGIKPRHQRLPTWWLETHYMADHGRIMLKDRLDTDSGRSSHFPPSRQWRSLFFENLRCIVPRPLNPPSVHLICLTSTFLQDSEARYCCTKLVTEKEGNWTRRGRTTENDSLIANDSKNYGIMNPWSR